MKNKQLLFSLSKKDFKLEFFRGSGNGGQNRNKVETGVRIYHPDSGAVAQSCEQRTQYQNKKTAFERLVKTPEFQKWHKIQCAKALGYTIDTDEWVNRQMDVKNMKFEIQVNGKWTEVKPENINYDDLED